MKVAALQMVSGADVPTNLRQADALLREAADAGAELASLPEYFCLLGLRDTDKLAAQEPLDSGPIQAFLSDAAQRHGLWIAGGTVPIATQDPLRVSNSCLVYAPSGKRVARYDKIHLFAFDNGAESYDESRVLRAGDTPVTFDLTTKAGTTWRVGLSICYDLRFPELYRQMRADLLLVPSAFTATTGKAHWEILLRARAVENLAYVVAAAQGGSHENGRSTWGHSMVIDPWGSVLAVQPQGAAVVLAELSMHELQQRRTHLPVLQHRIF